MSNRINLAVYLLAALSFSFGKRAESAQAPTYSAETIANTASNTATLAPYTYATIFGHNLSQATAGLSAEDLSAGWYPTAMAGVQVLVGGTAAVITFVSPDQINLLLPSGLRAANVAIQVTSSGLAGPKVTVPLADAAPALFLIPESSNALASRLDYSLATPEKPARPGDIVVLWAAGLGPTVPNCAYGAIPTEAAPLLNLSRFRVLLNGVELPPEDVLYAGIAPGFAGLYQVNVRLPATIGDNPEVRIAAGGQASPPDIHIPVRNSGSPRQEDTGSRTPQTVTETPGDRPSATPAANTEGSSDLIPLIRLSASVVDDRFHVNFPPALAANARNRSLDRNTYASACV